MRKSLLIMATLAFGLASPVIAKNPCADGVLYGGRCLTLEEWLGPERDAIKVPNLNTSIGPREFVMAEVQADQRAMAALERNRGFIRARDTGDIKSMLSFTQTTNLALIPGDPQMHKLCKPPFGTWVWQWQWTNINGGMVGAYAWICVPSKSNASSNPTK